MSTRVDNLYEHAEGGLYCLLSDTQVKDPTSGAWLDGVIYTGIDGKLRSTTLERWKARFTPVAEYDGDNEQVLSMIRRTNPGDQDLDYIRVMEAWHESEMNVTGHMLELAVAAAMDRMAAKMDWELGARIDLFGPFEVTISTEDLQRIVQTYEIERVPIPHGFTFRILRNG